MKPRNQTKQSQTQSSSRKWSDSLSLEFLNVRILVLRHPVLPFGQCQFALVPAILFTGVLLDYPLFTRWVCADVYCKYIQQNQPFQQVHVCFKTAPWMNSLHQLQGCAYIQLHVDIMGARCTSPLKFFVTLDIRVYCWQSDL